VPDVSSLFGKDIIERTKYSVIVFLAGLLMSLPNLFSNPFAKVIAIAVPLVIIVQCMKIAAYELESMAVSKGWSLQSWYVIALGLMTLMGLVMALTLAVLDWRLYLVLLFGTFATDSFALLGGRLTRYIAAHIPGYEAHPMMKSSPSKTMEGLVTGVLLGWVFTYITLYSCVWWAHLSISPFTVIVVGFIPVIAVLGDIFESIVKRTYGVKDSGTCLGAHGGLLDRIDSICAVFAVVGVALLLIQ